MPLLNNTSRFRGAWAPRFDPFAAAPTEGLRSADKAHSTSMVAPARRDSHVREAWAHLARVRAPLGAPHGDFWRRPALHLRRCRRIRRAWCARPGVAPGERGPKPPEPAISAAVQDATPAPSSGSSPETPLVEQDGRVIGDLHFVVNIYIRIVVEKISAARGARSRAAHELPNFKKAPIYENFPHARSVAHQMTLPPPTKTTPNTIHP